MSVNLSRLDVDQDKLKDLFNKTQDNFDELENQANSSEQRIDQLDNTKASRSEMQSADNNLAQQIETERQRINQLLHYLQGVRPATLSYEISEWDMTVQNTKMPERP